MTMIAFMNFISEISVSLNKFNLSIITCLPLRLNIIDKF